MRHCSDECRFPIVDAIEKNSPFSSVPYDSTVTLHGSGGDGVSAAAAGALWDLAVYTDDVAAIVRSGAVLYYRWSHQSLGEYQEGEENLGRLKPYIPAPPGRDHQRSPPSRGARRRRRPRKRTLLLYAKGRRQKCCKTNASEQMRVAATSWVAGLLHKRLCSIFRMNKYLSTSRRHTRLRCRAGQPTCRHAPPGGCRTAPLTPPPPLGR